MSLLDVYENLTLDEMILIRLCVNVAYESQIHGTHSSQLTMKQRTQLIILKEKMRKEHADSKI